MPFGVFPPCTQHRPFGMARARHGCPLRREWAPQRRTSERPLDSLMLEAVLRPIALDLGGLELALFFITQPALSLC
jgi:hypothetical protein